MQCCFEGCENDAVFILTDKAHDREVDHVRGETLDTSRALYGCAEAMGSPLAHMAKIIRRANDEGWTPVINALGWVA